MPKITEDQWYAHPSFRQELADLLNHPTLQVALSIVERAGLRPTPMTTGLDLRDFFALMGAKRDGYFESLVNLEALSKPKTEAVKPPKPWSHTTEKPAIDGDRKSAP